MILDILCPISRTPYIRMTFFDRNLVSKGRDEEDELSDSYFLTICLNPVLQKTIVLPCFKKNEVNRSNEYYLDAAGKGIITSRVLVQLDESVIHLTQAGGRNRELFLDMAAENKIPVRWVDSGSEIRFCYTLLDMEMNGTTEIVEEAAPVDPDTGERVYKIFSELLSDCHTVIISGTKAAGFSEGLYPQMVKDAKEAGKIVIADYREDDLVNSLPACPDVIKPNYSEFIRTFFREYQTINNENPGVIKQKIKEKILWFYRNYKTRVILTNSDKPVYYSEDGEMKEITPEMVVPLNTTGCGDAFTAGFAVEYRITGNMTLAVRKGLECAKKNALTKRPGRLIG